MAGAFVVVLRYRQGGVFGRMRNDDIGFIKKQNPDFAVAKPG
jgi:hypothetical protein